MEKWLSPRQVAERYSVSYETARAWIIRLMREESGSHKETGDPASWSTKTKGRWGKRPYSLRRIPEAVLEAHLHELMNRR